MNVKRTGRITRWTALSLTAALAMLCSNSTANQATSNAPLSSPTQSPTYSAPAHRNFAGIMATAPHAYTGACRVEQRGDRWWQLGHDITSLPAPVPCANLTARIGQTFSTAPEPNQRYLRTEMWTGSKPSATDKLWIKANQEPNGDWLVSWGAKTGVRVEWVLAFAGPEISGSGGSYRWSADQHHGSYPTVSVYANDLDAPPGHTMSITGPPQPAP